MEDSTNTLPQSGNIHVISEGRVTLGGERRRRRVCKRSGKQNGTSLSRNSSWNSKAVYEFSLKVSIPAAGPSLIGSCSDVMENLQLMIMQGTIIIFPG